MWKRCDSDVWRTPLAGRWYSGNAAALRRVLDGLTPPESYVAESGVRAVIVPHAGYQYSGRVAMAAYARLDFTRFERVVVIGPSHYTGLRDSLSALDVAHIATPLGACAVDLEWLRRLAASGFLVNAPQAHSREHSDQIQLPLLQHFFGERPWRLAALVCGQFTAESALACGRALRALLDERTLLVTSTDFTHYGASFGYLPFSDNIAARLRKLDHEVFDSVAAGDVAGLYACLRQTGATVCGAHPLALLMAAAGREAVYTEVAYEQSGNISGDWEHCVSYLGATVKW